MEKNSYWNGSWINFKLDERTSKINEMKMKELKELLVEFGDDVKFDHDLKNKNWFNIGGKTKVFYKANNLKELVKFLKK